MSKAEGLMQETLKQAVKDIVSNQIQRSPTLDLLTNTDEGLVANAESFRDFIKLGYSHYVVVYKTYVDFFEVKKKRGWGINNYEGDVIPTSLEGKISSYDYVAFPNTRTGEVIVLLKESIIDDEFLDQRR